MVQDRRRLHRRRMRWARLSKPSIWWWGIRLRRRFRSAWRRARSSGCCSLRPSRIRQFCAPWLAWTPPSPVRCVSRVAGASCWPRRVYRCRMRSRRDRTSCCSTPSTRGPITRCGYDSPQNAHAGRASSSRRRASTKRAAATGCRWRLGRRTSCPLPCRSWRARWPARCRSSLRYSARRVTAAPAR